MKIVAFDPAYKQIGSFIYTYEGSILNCIELEAVCFVNEFDASYEDKFLYNLSMQLRRLINNDIHLLMEYTEVPRFKSTTLINRVIGVIYATLHPYIISWHEISMNTIYSHFKVTGKNKKAMLHKVILKNLPDLITLRKINLTKESVKLEKIPKEKLPPDCLDAYSLVKYTLDISSKKT